MGILLTMDADQGVEAMRIINPRESRVVFKSW